MFCFLYWLCNLLLLRSWMSVVSSISRVRSSAQIGGILLSLRILFSYWLRSRGVILHPVQWHMGAIVFSLPLRSVHRQVEMDQKKRAQNLIFVLFYKNTGLSRHLNSFYFVRLETVRVDTKGNKLGGKVCCVCRFEVEYDRWKYSYNPCISYNLPRNPHDGGGDGCHYVTVRVHLKKKTVFVQMHVFGSWILAPSYRFDLSFSCVFVI